MGADAPASSLFHHLAEKGAITPFPITSSIPLALHSCVTMPSCGSGLGFPHPVEHTGTLTPPIVRGTSVSHSAKDRRTSARLQFGQEQGIVRQRIGRGTPPPRAAPHRPIYHGYRVLTTADDPHPPFPDALMARHNAGGRGVWSGSVPASVPPAGAPRSEGPSARLLTSKEYHTRGGSVKRILKNGGRSKTGPHCAILWNIRCQVLLLDRILTGQALAR